MGTSKIHSCVNGNDSYSPLVSIVIPCYNHDSYVRQTIESVINQSYDNIELIIIDDGSRDKSVKRIQEMVAACKERFKRFEVRSRSNKGLCATLNEALDWCEGEFFSPIASDDIMKKNKTKLQVDFLRANPDCRAVFGGVELIDSRGNLKSEKNKISFKFRFSDLILGGKIPAAPTQMIRLADVRAVGGYPEHLFIEDWYMWLRLTENGGLIANVPHTLVQYRRHLDNASSQLDKMANSRQLILDRYKQHPLYTRAVSFSILSHATDLQIINKRMANALLLKLLVQAPEVLVSKRFYYFILKALTPMCVIKKIYGNRSRAE